MLPGIAPTHRKVSIPLVVVVTFEGNKVRPDSRELPVIVSSQQASVISAACFLARAHETWAAFAAA